MNSDDSLKVAGRGVLRLVCRYRVQTAFLFGASCALLREAAARVGLEWGGAVIVCVVFPAVLIVLNSPFVSFRMALALTLAGSVGLTLTSPLTWRLYYGYWSPVPVEWLPLGFLALWLVLSALSLTVVGVRRRTWPVIEEGCCQKCGYSLYGLTSKRCPECGTAIAIVSRHPGDRTSRRS